MARPGVDKRPRITDGKTLWTPVTRTQDRGKNLEDQSQNQSNEWYKPRRWLVVKARKSRYQLTHYQRVCFKACHVWSQWNCQSIRQDQTNQTSNGRTCHHWWVLVATLSSCVGVVTIVRTIPSISLTWWFISTRVDIYWRYFLTSRKLTSELCVCPCPCVITSRTPAQHRLGKMYQGSSSQSFGEQMGTDC